MWALFHTPPSPIWAGGGYPGLPQPIQFLMQISSEGHRTPIKQHLPEGSKMADICALAEQDFLQFHSLCRAFWLKLEPPSTSKVPQHTNPLQHNPRVLSLWRVKRLPLTAPNYLQAAGMSGPSTGTQLPQPEDPKAAAIWACNPNTTMQPSPR
ncbi:Hypothetical predicted protein [Pelobates cultripes]|uniref:Uncharacterized protein n=1 Tax=Pelobates cultripes TaxID=61616 RepID=A0AAD1TJC5_PELCU|nr:Hypothetical predicted protein [Pelobates cultripes]